MNQVLAKLNAKKQAEPSPTASPRKYKFYREQAEYTYRYGEDATGKEAEIRQMPTKELKNYVITRGLMTELQLKFVDREELIKTIMKYHKYREEEQKTRAASPERTATITRRQRERARKEQEEYERKQKERKEELRQRESEEEKRKKAKDIAENHPTVQAIMSLRTLNEVVSYLNQHIEEITGRSDKIQVADTVEKQKKNILRRVHPDKCYTNDIYTNELCNAITSVINRRF
jgi:multidrug efflux pump subunit AcrB